MKGVKVRLEVEPTFSLATQLANKPWDECKFEELVEHYSALDESPELIVEKSHPVVWYVERLHREFPNAKFIGVLRDPYQVVNSMLNHGGVMGWYKSLPQDEINQFLGITPENRKYFDYLPIESKCALKWKAHADRLEELKELDYVRVYDFEKLLFDSENQYLDMCEFIGLEPQKCGVEPKQGVVEKANSLSHVQRENIKPFIV